MESLGYHVDYSSDRAVQDSRNLALRIAFIGL